MAIMKSLLTRLYHSENAQTPPSNEPAKPDIVSRLPFELHIFILAQLEPKDIDAGLSVCRQWRAIWLSDEIWPKLAQRWFPGLEDHIRKSAAEGQDQNEMFRKALHKIQRRMSGRFASAFHHEMSLETDQLFTLSKDVPLAEGGVHSYEDVDGLEFGSGTHYPRFMMYDNGRIAWWPEAYVLPYLAVVDDLRTRKRRAYLFPNNYEEKQGYKTAMSDKLLLMGRGRILNAWHLELDRLHSTQVPEEFVRCITEGEKILVLTRSGEVFLWRFGQEPQYIDITGCYEKGPVGTAHPYNFILGQFTPSHNIGSRLVRSGTLLDFIISPTEDDVLFAITYDPAPLKELRVNEIRNGQLVATYRIDRSNWADVIMDYGDFSNLRWEKVDSFGGYSLMNAASETTATTREPTCPPNSSILVSVCFNIYTKAFTIPHYHRIDSHNYGSVYQIRNSRIAASDTDSPRGTVLSLHPCSSGTHPYEKYGPTPFYSTITRGSNGPLRRQRMASETNEWDADFVLDFNGPLKTNSADITSIYPPLIRGVRRLVGDDDFLLLVVRQSYIVWSFGDEIPGSTTDGRRSLWRKLIR
ncbi:hypothetical protein F4781DRAFT_389739 [Annulohypoxylon bovei var. microspora]|nr:hypothetical protein F4781DRAFT_389739 [Annulohypoxylon bovei var. microspora]